MNNPVYHLVLKRHKTAKKTDFTNMSNTFRDFDFLEVKTLPAWQYSPPTRFEVDVRGMFDTFMKQSAYNLNGKESVYTIELLIDSFDENDKNIPKIICSRNFYASDYTETAKNVFFTLFSDLYDSIQIMLKEKDSNVLWKEYDKYQKQMALTETFLDEEEF